jgi:hypothetical protein
VRGQDRQAHKLLERIKFLDSRRRA